MLKHIDDWKNAPVWTPKKLANKLKNGFFI